MRELIIVLAIIVAVYAVLTVQAIVAYVRKTKTYRKKSFQTMDELE